MKNDGRGELHSMITKNDVHQAQQQLLDTVGSTVLQAADDTDLSTRSLSLLGPTSSPPTAPDRSRTFPKDWRRRSADVGGLHLATKGLGQGQGWMGGDPSPLETIYAELLSDMYTETLNSVNDHSVDSVPKDLPEAVRSRLIHSLSRWHFEPHTLPDEEVLACTIILFEALFRIEGMRQAIPVDISQIIEFLHHLRRIYRYENTYHNFEHALDVLQATHCYLKSAGMVPPPTILFSPNQLWKPQKGFNSGSLISCLGLRELFALYIAAIGHDVGHPGFTNMFMKNANTPLSLLFDHTSALEQMHYQLLKRVMRCRGLGVILDDPLHGKHVREILRSSVIFTDMGVHNDFMAQFKKLIDTGEGTISQRQTLVCQALLKNADISNPSRPFYVSTLWAKALMQEWKAQANLEEEYDLKPSVMSSSDPIKEAESQIFFISHFVKPMLQLTVKAVPEVSCYLNHLKSNLRTWVKRKEELSKRPQAILPMLPQVPIQPRRHRQRQEIWQGTTANRSSAEGLPSTSCLSCPITDGSSQSPLPPSFVSFSFQNGVAAPLSLTPPRTQADSFMTAFPLTLPTYPPPKKSLASNAGSNGWIRSTSSSSSSSSMSSHSVSDHETGPLNSPSVESTSEFLASRVQSQVFSPISETLSVGSGNNSSINYRPVAHRCRSNSSVSNSSVCNRCGASLNPSSINSPGPPIDSNPSFRIWCSPTQFCGVSPNSIVDEAADDDDEKHASTAHAAIRNASLLGSLRQRRQKDVSGVVSLKDFIAGVDRESKATSISDTGTTTNTMPGLIPMTTRRAARYSWCAGMAGLNGGNEILSSIRQYAGATSSNVGSTDTTQSYYSTLSHISSDGGSGSSVPSSPEILSVAAPSSAYCNDAALSVSIDEDETITFRSTTTLSQISRSLSRCSTDVGTLDSTSMPRLSSAPIKFQPLRVRSP